MSDEHVSFQIHKHICKKDGEQIRIRKSPIKKGCDATQIRIKKVYDDHGFTELMESVSTHSLELYNQWCQALLQKCPSKYNANKFLYGGISEYLLKKII